MIHDTQNVLYRRSLQHCPHNLITKLACNYIDRDRPTLRDLLIHVIPSVAITWYELGLVLLDPKYQNALKSVEADTRNDSVTTSCRKMFSKWLDTDELASWDKLIKALRIVQLNDVANDIEQLLLQGEYATDLPWYNQLYNGNL